MKTAFRKYRRGDLEIIWASLRPEDYQEISTGGFTEPAVLEDMMLLEAPQVFTLSARKKPVAVVGVTRTDNPDIGLIWALASTEAQPSWRYAVRHTDRILSTLGQGFKVLANFKDNRNTQQIKWLRRVGFTFINTHETDEATYLEFVRIVT